MILISVVQAEDSLLAIKFSGRWEDNHMLDSDGRIFLDWDPNCFRHILSFMRAKAIQHPDYPTQQPIIPTDMQAPFRALVRFLSMEGYMG